MRLLLIHQNFPGQFRQLAPHLIERGHDLVAICSHGRTIELPLRLFRYPPPQKNEVPRHFGASLWEEALQRAESVAHLVAGLIGEGWKPNCILAHCGWGETLGLSELLPDVPQLLWPELWVRPEHGGYGSDPLKPPVGLPHKLEQVGRNALTRVALDHARGWIVSTQHQARSFPSDLQSIKMHVIHEGIDTEKIAPNSSVSYEVCGITIDRSVPTITFVNRNFERLRGFDFFMRALPFIQKMHPGVRVLVVGDDQPGYAGPPVGGRPLRESILNELNGQLDLGRIHFLGRIPHPQLTALMQASWIHVYLSYPFVLGWSLIEAMACGCCIVGSSGMPVEEVIQDGVEGFLVPMGDIKKLEQRIIALLSSPSLRQQLGVAARLRSLEWSQNVTLPQVTHLIEAL